MLESDDCHGEVLHGLGESGAVGWEGRLIVGRETGGLGSWAGEVRGDCGLEGGGHCEYCGQGQVVVRVVV